jgi:hypothetical protein
MANKKHIRLNSARDVHKLLSKMINERRRKEIDTKECRDIGFLAKILLDSIEAAELEDRIGNLEKPQTLEVQHSIFSEEEQKILISHYRRIELGIPHPSRQDTEGEIVELVSEVPDL